MFLDRSFCMESGQIKSGSTVEDTYHKMLQQIHRVTPPIADAITGTYKTVHALIRAFQRGGPDILEDLQVYPDSRTKLMVAAVNGWGKCFTTKDWSSAFEAGI
jgi:hypothetical protein